MLRPPPISEFPHYPVTAGVILLAAVVSVMYWTGSSIDWLVMDTHLRDGQAWRLITSTLPHADILHLAFNCYWLWVFGTLIERSMGFVYLLLLILLLAVASMGADYAFTSGGIGLSGVGYGLFGYLWVLSQPGRKFDGAVDSRTAWLFGIWFVFCVITTMTGTLPVANVAHGVGALMGGLIGYAESRRPMMNKRAIFGIAIAVTVGLACLAGFARPWVNVSHDDIPEASRGYDELKADHNDAAVAWFEKAVKINPGDASAWFDLGIAYDQLGRTSDAGAAFVRASKLEPDNKKYQNAANRNALEQLIK